MRHVEEPPEADYVVCWRCKLREPRHTDWCTELLAEQQAKDGPPCECETYGPDACPSCRDLEARQTRHEVDLLVALVAATKNDPELLSAIGQLLPAAQTWGIQ